MILKSQQNIIELVTRPDHIQHANLDGTDLKTISSRMIKHPFSLVVYGQKLFVTDWRLDAIIEMDKLSGGNDRIVEKVAETNRLYGIKIYSKSAQKIVDQVQITPVKSEEVASNKVCIV